MQKGQLASDFSGEKVIIHMPVAQQKWNQIPDG